MSSQKIGRKVQTGRRPGLDNNARLKITYLIIVSEFGCDTNKLIDTKHFHFLAEEIVKLFPQELKDTYYISSYTPKGGQTVQARGKLIDKYNTIARSLRENGIRPRYLFDQENLRKFLLNKFSLQLIFHFLTLRKILPLRTA